MLLYWSFGDKCLYRVDCQLFGSLALLSLPLKEESFERINFGNWENCYTFASHITDYRTVRWVSGLNQQFAKLPYGLPYRGFESPPHRKRVQRGRRACSSGFFVPFCKARRQAGGDVRPQGANPPVRILGAWLLGCATAGSSDIV